MGYKCPVCKKDFRKDRPMFYQHITNNHDGVIRRYIEFTEKARKNLHAKAEQQAKAEAV